MEIQTAKQTGSTVETEEEEYEGCVLEDKGGKTLEVSEETKTF